MQFVNYLDSHQIIAKHQNGNRKFHSTEIALLFFTDENLAVVVVVGVVGVVGVVAVAG